MSAIATWINENCLLCFALFSFFSCGWICFKEASILSFFLFLAAFVGSLFAVNVTKSFPPGDRNHWYWIAWAIVLFPYYCPKRLKLQRAYTVGLIGALIGLLCLFLLLLLFSLARWIATVPLA